MKTAMKIIMSLQGFVRLVAIGWPLLFSVGVSVNIDRAANATRGAPSQQPNELSKAN